MNSSEVNQFNVHSPKFSFNRSVEVKQCTDCSQRFYFNSSELKKGIECSQRPSFNRSDGKQHSERSHRFHFNNNDELKE